MAESGVGEELLVYQERGNSKNTQTFTDLEIVICFESTTICSEYLSANIFNIEVHCSPDKPCLNGGTCINDACSCLAFFSGDRCESGKIRNIV